MMTDIANQTRNESANQKVGAAARLLSVLSDVAQSSDPVSVRELARRQDLSPSTAHRLLNTLRDEGFVHFSHERREYGVGPELYRLSALVSTRLGPITLAARIAESVAAEFDETILFGLYLPAAGAMSFEARGDGNKKLKYHVEMHTPAPLIWGASGKAIVAYLPEETRKSLLAGAACSPASGESPPALAAFEGGLSQIRQQGYAISRGEKLAGAHGIAAPVFDPGGVIGSLCLTSPQDRLPQDSLAKAGKRVAEVARTLSHQLGASQ